MEYSYNQKMAIVRLLLDIISVDGKIDGRETFFFEKVKNELDLSPQDHFKIHDYSTLQSLSIIKAMGNEQKNYYSDLMKRMIMADEEIEENERVAYKDICEFCNIPLTSIA
jgi:uncharacterized tellurite resistance protein B-like protein